LSNAGKPSSIFQYTSHKSQLQVSASLKNWNCHLQWI